MWNFPAKFFCNVQNCPAKSFDDIQEGFFELQEWFPERFHKIQEFRKNFTKFRNDFTKFRRIPWTSQKDYIRNFIGSFLNFIESFRKFKDSFLNFVKSFLNFLDYFLWENFDGSFFFAEKYWRETFARCGDFFTKKKKFWREYNKL